MLSPVQAGAGIAATDQELAHERHIDYNHALSTSPSWKGKKISITFSESMWKNISMTNSIGHFNITTISIEIIEKIM